MAIIMTSLINTMSATSPTPPSSSSSSSSSSVSSSRPISHVAMRRGLSEHNISIKLPSNRWTYRSKFSASLETDMSAPDAEVRAGLPVYKPSSYDVLVKDAAKALSFALDENKRRLEIDFPPLPSSISGYKGSSDEFIDANIQLVLALIRKLYDLKRVSSCVVFPDKPEARRASRVFKPALELMNGVSFGSLDDIPGGAGSNFFKTLRNAFDFDFENNNEEEWKSDDKPALFFFVNCSTSELLAIEQYVESFATELPTVLFNLELDTLRSDLGLFGFPTKDVHYRFLSQFLPVFYIRTRDYSKSITTAPFVLDYSGALLRIYPGPWEVMLKQGDGSYVCVAESPDRFTLGQTKQELLVALGLQEEEGSTMEFLRRGYKNSTWWEEDLELEESSAWRK